MIRRAFKLVPVIALGVLLGSQSTAVAQNAGPHWVGTWATALMARTPNVGALAPPGPAGGPGQAADPLLSIKNQTLRQVVHTSIGGQQVRVVLSNGFGTAPLSVGAAAVALREKDAAISSKSVRALTFAGNPSVTIPPGAIVVSDSVTLSVPPLTDLSIDIYLPGDAAASVSALTTHLAAHQTNYLSPPGNYTGVPDIPGATATTSWFFLQRVEVTAPGDAGAIVAFGDSITDGTRSTDNHNNRWPDQLAKRLMAQNIKMGVLNAGIGNNRVLSEGTGPNALARFDRDVLTATGVTHVILLEGINDIDNQTPAPSASDLIIGYRQLIERAHTRGLEIYGATLTPCEGTGRWSPQVEKTRQELNEWIRTSKMFDGLIDFDAVVRDPDHPTKLLPQYDGGDHLHPSDAGYEAMARAIDLSLFKER